MSLVSWQFYRSRRRIKLQALIDSGRVSDYATFVAYCSLIDVIPATQQEFDIEFGPLLNVDSKSASVSLPEDQAPEVAFMAAHSADSNSAAGLEATVWLAGVDDEDKKSSVTSSKKKKKFKESQGDSQD